MKTYLDMHNELIIIIILLFLLLPSSSPLPYKNIVRINNSMASFNLFDDVLLFVKVLIPVLFLLPAFTTGDFLLISKAKLGLLISTIN